MNKRLVAKELLKMAKELLAIDFPTKDAMDKYLKDHPDANRSNHKVVKIKKPSDKSHEKLERAMGDHIAEHIRDSLLHTDKVVTEEQMLADYNKSIQSKGHMGVNAKFFKKIWNEEVEAGGLEKVDGGYKWNV